MTVRSAVPVSLRACERHRLKKLAYGHKTPHQLHCRAEVVLAADRGHSNNRIARDTGPHLDTVRTWRDRFASGGLPTLADRKRSGRPPSAAWHAEVRMRTGELRTPATPIPTRLRELEVHHADLDAGYGFSDVPADAARWIIEDIADALARRQDTPPLRLAATDSDLVRTLGPGGGTTVRGR
ncbi:helix-turn-helix domain-containing protein [Streptomyces sp. NPDC047017]|uniref:helix-turn-helix domain-containing protein n=1 Tax=Streptomyces sp. NPDC047017 TaxID=3155024 RepID=UPI0033E96CB6